MNRVRAQYKQTLLERLEKRSKYRSIGFAWGWNAGSGYWRQSRWTSNPVDHKAIAAAEAKRARRIERNKRLEAKK